MEEPKTIARYRLTGELGRGGMGVVYRAEDPQLGRPVAIKVILFPAQATDEFREQLEQRFEREARSAAGIRHPGVVTVHDFGRDGDYLYLVMELVDGESLADRLKTGWLPERAEAFDLVAQVADALAAAHDAGVVHRDVTPRNILLAADGQVGRVVVTDFGIARSIGEETFELTRTGMLVGSPSFMAPEQVRNQPFDGRADVFSLGVVLYLLLTGKLPFQSQDLTSLLYQIVHENPLESGEIKGRLGLGTVQFLKKCLAKDAGDRVQKARDFAREARRLRAAAQTAELEETVALGALAGDGDRGSRRGGRWLLALALLAATAAGVWGLSRFFAGKAPEPAPSAAVARSSPEERPPPPAATPATEATEEAAPPDTESLIAQTTDEENALGPAATETPGDPGSEREPTASPEPVRPAEPPEVAAPAGDTVPPVLAIDDMPKELTATEVVLSGRVMDARSEVALTVDGEPLPVADDGAFIARRPLSPGRNDLVFVAVDATGNRTMKSIEVSAPAAGGAETAANPQDAGDRPAAAGPRPRERPRFADRGDGTLVDTLTGIMWTKWVEDAGTGWKAAKTYCKKLELGRHRDWTLPTIDEIEELYRSGIGIPDLMIWSSTRNGLSKAWAFDFSQGQRNAQPVAVSEATDVRAFCLRRQRPQGGDQLPRQGNPLGPGDSRAPPPGGGQNPPRGGGPGGGEPGGGGGGPGGGGPGG